MTAHLFWLRVKQLIKLNNTTQEAFAKSISVSYRTLQNWMSREIFPDVSIGYKISKELHVSISFLLTGQEDETTELMKIKQKIRDLANEI